MVVARSDSQHREFVVVSAPVNIIVGSHVWVEDPTLAWIGGEVTKISGENVHVRTRDGKTLKLVSKEDPWTERVDFLIEIMVSFFEKQQSQKEAINALPLYSNEQIMWDESVVSWTPNALPLYPSMKVFNITHLASLFLGVKLDNATTIATFDPNEKTYNINGKDVQGHFMVDYTAAQIDHNVSILIFKLIVLLQYQAFYDQHDVKLVDKVLEMLRLYTIDFISSPEIGFLTSVNEKVRKKTKFVFQFLNASDVEPTTMQPYGTIVKDLAAIKSYASGIIVPKEYIWPVKPDNYLRPLTTLVSDAHKQGLEVYASSFANDFFSSYYYNYDPTAEYLQFIAKDECVDGLVTDFPSTASNSIGSTNLAYQQAIDDEADIIDCSVQMTKDGISFCSNTADLMADTTAMTKFMSRTSNVPEIQPNSGIFSFDLKEPGSNIYVKNIDDSVSDEELKSQFVQINKENRKQLPYQIT
ncbi:hypothetical protein RYX36_005910, partial [Vicia faba]